MHPPVFSPRLTPATRRAAVAFFALFLSVGHLSAETAPWSGLPTGRTDYQIWSGEDQLFSIETRLVGPDWTQARLRAMSETQGERRVFAEEAVFAPRGPQGKNTDFQGSALFEFTAGQSGPQSLTLTTKTRSANDLEATGVVTVVSTTDFFLGGKGVATMADGQTSEFSCPLGMAKIGENVTSLALTAPSGETLLIKASKPVRASGDRGELRIWSWHDALKADQPEEATLTFEFPHPIKVETASRIVDTSNWIPLVPRQDFAPGSPIGAEDWLDAPAGKHGWVQMDGQHFVFEKKREPFKFWGANIAYSAMAVEPEEAVKWADRFAKYGVNIVRYHKWTGNKGWDGVMSREDVLEFDEAASRKFDHIHAEMKKRGIYAGWSPIFAPVLHDSMAKYIPNYAEIKENTSKRGEGLFTNSLYPLSTFAPDVQDFFIALTVKWLERKNEFTGLRYADDPAVAYVELHNVADIFFPGIGNLVKNYPTYEKLMCEKFGNWLAQKYPDQAALAAAWGRDLAKNESLEQRNIFPFPRYNGTFPAPRRVVDSYTFLYDYQNEFYDRYIAAIRATGYQGAIVSGCWQAADMYGHLFNIASDRRAGFIDRHNYFRNARPMLTQPGSALMSAGMQQVGDRPFGLTEWACGHVWASEAQPMIGLIGLGLNGWDYSAQFASGSPYLLPDNAAGINANFDELIATGQHPFIARFLYSGALKEGKNVASRRISMQQLLDGKVPFEESFSLLGGANLKNFEGAVPNEAIGAGRVTLDFVSEPVEPAVITPDLDQYLDREKRLIHASNGQIFWDYSGRGFFTTDTPVAQAVIGFGGGRNHALSDVTISYENSYANVYVAAARPGETLADAKQIIIMTLARTANRGDVIEETSMEPLHREVVEQSGSREQRLAAKLTNPRLLVEPVRATFTLKRTDPCRVFALDHDGCLPADAQPVPVTRTAEGQQFTVDGAQSGTLYYLVDFKP